MDFYATAGQIEEHIAAGFVVQGVVAPCGHRAIEILQVQNVGAHALGFLYGGDNAFQQEGIGDTDNERSWCSTVDADAAEVGLHCHVRFYDAGVWNGFDDVEE